MSTTIILLVLSVYQQTVFEPLTAGNQLVYGEFTINIPNGTYYAVEEDAPNMYPLLKFHTLNNGIGVFYDANANWDWAIGVQYFPNQTGDTTLDLSELDLQEFFKSTQHLHFLAPLSETNEATVLYPPNLSNDLSTFEIGYHYSAGLAEHLGYFAKKVFMGNEGTLVLMARIEEANFIDRIETVERVLNEAVSLTPTQPEQTVKAVPYPNFLGIEIKPDEKVKIHPEDLNYYLEEKMRLEREAAVEDIPFVNYWLFGGAIALLAIAFGLKAVMKKG